MQSIPGTYYLAASSQCCAALLRYSEHNITVMAIDDGHSVLWQSEDFSTGADLPGLPLEIRFADGSYFLPDSSMVRLNPRHRAGLATRLEQHKGIILLSVFLVPVLLWWTTMVGIPKLAVAIVPWVPPAAIQAVDKQTLLILDKTWLNPSELPIQTQQQLQQQWLQAMATIPQRHQVPVDIQFRQSKHLGPNAFALPAGTVVFTDELVNLLQDNPDALLAVFLHEVGHVRYQHGMTLLVQSTATSLVFAMLFTDLEGITEVILGGGSSLLQAAFSRQMETQADDFSTNLLHKLGKTNAGFIEAMQAISGASDGKTGKELENWTRYLSSHPSSEQRINKAKTQQKSD
ncbi:MAG: M48 family metallopeptidase [Gammaproteobacteria bacterium]|nr:M48 family metallopeptidase [Gammaproteobacteria bacterium]MBU2428829.1 M48 family metallopeptidase [Gammaproteobacteria bacterium]